MRTFLVKFVRTNHQHGTAYQSHTDRTIRADWVVFEGHMAVFRTLRSHQPDHVLALNTNVIDSIEEQA